MTQADTPSGDHPWMRSYPDGIDWNIAIDTTPVHKRFFECAKRMPDAAALDFLGATVSYRELARQAEAFAAALQDRFDVKKGTRVALLLPNTPFFPIAYYGVLRAGGTVVNCNPLYSVPELSHIVGDSGAEILVTLDLKQVFDKAEALVEAGHIKSVICCHFPAALPLVKRALFMLARRKELAVPGRSAISASITRFTDMVRQEKTLAPVTIDSDTDVAVQQYTGGTTGEPKGALLSHANVSANTSQIEAWSDGLFAPGTRVVAVLPFFHIFAMTTCMNAPLCTGCQVVMLPRFEIGAFRELLRRTRPNMLMAVPTLIAAIVRTRSITAENLSCLEAAVSGGAPLSPEMREEYAAKSGTLLAEGYGLTEASPVVTCAAFRKPSKPHSIGLPIPGTELRFVDVDSGDVVPFGENGELQVRGPQVMLGYYRNEEATSETLVDGWLRTGDVGHMDEDGYVYLVDRIKDLIISSGYNVYPRKIEEALLEHDAVEEVTVIGVPDSYRGEAPVAFVKLRANENADEAELKQFLTDRLNKVEMPREFIFKDELPKTLIGKLSKKEPRAEYADMKDQPRE